MYSFIEFDNIILFDIAKYQILNNILMESDTKYLYRRLVLHIMVGLNQ